MYKKLNSSLISRDISYLHGAVPWFWCNFQPVCLYGELKNEGHVGSSHYNSSMQV